ncbi:hypothetical protein [Hominifimenecus sp. rT4P-3]|uniref:hypothetical protein n=1 Tax=Hominifimenecus sp. rT4P-3 TaxID=3242979 RepID=UPI003DA1D19C
MDLLPYIPVGRRNARSRFEIADCAGVSERTVRDAIAEINKTGRAKVIADSIIGGYYIPKFPEDAAYYKAYLRQEYHRAGEILDKIRAMEGRSRKKESMPGQLSLFKE